MRALLRNILSRWPQLLLATGIFFLIAPLFLLKDTPTPVEEAMTDAPPELITAYTSGLISRRATIRVRFVSDVVAASAVGKPLEVSPFSFDPAIEGQAEWVSAAELNFRPAAHLPPGTSYAATLDLPALVPGKPNLRPWTFRFGVATQSFTATLVGLEAEAEEGTVQRHSGRIKLADVADNTEVEKILVAKHGDDPLTVTWTHDDASFEHSFVIHGIRRTERASTLTLNFDGAPIGVLSTDLQSVAVPGLNDFVVSSVRAEPTGDRFIEIRFSDPIDPKQDLRGLIRVEGRDDLRIERDGSVLRVYASAPWSQTEVVHIAGVRNARGFKLLDPRDETVSFAPIKPQVRFVGESAILPTSADLTVPIEVVNVRAIEIEATRVYESNVPQFLQVNNLGGSSELRRVGTVVWKDRVEIPAVPGQNNRWVRLGLDLSELVRQHPTGLYRLGVSFTRSDITYDCPSPAWEEKEAKPQAPWDNSTGDRSFWDFWSDNDEDGDADWDWSDDPDPCNRAYYAQHSWSDHGQRASRNVIVTDLGLVAKQGTGGSITAFVTNLRTAVPVSGAKVDLLDYQLQTLASATADGDGRVVLSSAEQHPFALVSHANGQASWLRLDRGSALSVSHFDVGGAEISNGLKGYLYGERGVWRPGDPIYLSFVVHDETGQLPASHPVEFRLRNPRGQEIEHRTITTSTDGFTRIDTRTPADAPTGNYTALVRVGGATFQKTLRVETILPNRLKIDLPVPAVGVRAPELSLKSTLNSRWLHGAIAGGLKAEIQMELKPTATTFPRYADYSFDDPTAAFSAEPSQIWEGHLDSAGNATVEADLSPPASPGMLTATLRTRVYEPSGAASVDETALKLSPYERYVGINTPKGDAARGILLTDTRHKVSIVSVDADGKPGGNDKVTLSLREIRWRWWWEKGDEDLTEYAGAESRGELARGEVTLKNGQGSWDFDVKYPQWGRYLITARNETTGHTTGRIVYIDWPGWAGRAQKDNPGGASVLNISADKPKVEVGQLVTLSFPMPRGGRALVSLENGSQVVSAQWVDANTGSDTASVQVAATPEMAPTIYAHVTVIQPHQSAANDAPIRLYGVIPIAVFDPATKLQPKISTSETFKPETTALVSVSEGGGRAMTYTLAVVDEGLLGLTRYATPNPWDTMYAREALGVRTWDLFDWVAGAYGGTLEGILGIGGDGEADSNKRPKAQRFKPMVWYDGPFTLPAGQTAQHKVAIPQYVGEVRVMVVAGKGGAFGSAEKAVPVRSPLMALATLPRVLGPDEEVALPVSLFAMEPRVKEVTVSVTTEGPLSVLQESRHTVRFAQPGEAMSTFRLKVGSALGVARVTVLASGGGEKTTQTLEIDVRHPGAPVTRVVATTLQPGKSWSEDLALVGLAGTNEATLEMSRMPPVNLGTRLQYLLQYPHGCVEQTTSAAFPQLALSDLMELSPAQAASAETNVRAAIERLRLFQAADGGFGYWPGEPSQAWASNYAGHFLVEAERAGYLLPQGMRSRWVNYQRDRANRWYKGLDRSDLDQAYRLYTLALAGSADLGAMNRLKETTLSSTARWELAAAYALAGQKAASAEVIAKADTKVDETRELSGTFGSGLRDQALILEAQVGLGNLDAAMRMAQLISKELSSDNGLSTQETAVALVAMTRLGRAAGSTGPVAFSWSFQGGAPVAVRSDKPVAQVALPVGKGERGKIEVKNSSSVPLFGRAILRGLPPVGGEESGSQGLGLGVLYLDLNDEPLSVDSLEQGMDFVVAVEITNQSGRRLDELALTQIFPSGWEIGGLSPGKGEGYEYRDVRDDRVYTYLDLDAGASVSFRIPVNASYQGHFYLPPVSVETMYDPSLFARQKGQWVDVAAQPEG